MKSILNSNSLTFYNVNGQVTKKLTGTSFTGAKEEVPVWGDFDNQYFLYDNVAKKIVLNPQMEDIQMIFNQQIGNNNNQTITFCAINLESTLALGKFNYEIGLKRVNDSFIFKVQVSIYADTLTMADATSFYSSTGKVNIAVGVYVDTNINYLIIAPSENQTDSSSTAIYCINPLDTKRITLQYSTTSTNYVFI